MNIRKPLKTIYTTGIFYYKRLFIIKRLSSYNLKYLKTHRDSFTLSPALLPLHPNPYPSARGRGKRRYVSQVSTKDRGPPPLPLALTLLASTHDR